MRIIKYILTCVIVFVVVTSYSQKGFEVYGKLKVDGGSSGDSKVVIYKDGKNIKNVVVQRSGVFDVQLDFGADYILSFEKDGFVTKKLQFNTKVPEDRIEDGFQPFDFEVSLFPQYEGVNTVVYNQPVGKIGYNKAVDEFDYDTDYTKSIQAELAKVNKEVAKKKKEIAKNPPKKPTNKPRTYPIQQQAQQKKPTQKTSPARKTNVKPPKETIEVRMSVYTAAQYGSSSQSSYGYINYGSGGGVQDLSKDQFDQKRNEFYDSE